MLYYARAFLRVSLHLHKWGGSSAAGARIEALKAPRGWGVGRWCPPPHRGRGWRGGCAPSPEFFLILALNMVSFGAFWMVFFTVQLLVLHAKPV